MSISQDHPQKTETLFAVDRRAGATAVAVRSSSACVLDEEFEEASALIEIPETREAFPVPVIPEVTELPRESGWVRLLRVSIAIPLLALSCVALAPFSVMPISSQAVVNARLSAVEAPFAGQVGDVKFETGDRIENRQVLALLGPSPLERRRALEAGEDPLLQESSRVGAALAGGQAEKARYDAAYEAYVRRSIDDLNGRIAEARRTEQQAEKHLEAAGQELARDRQALSDHLVSRTAVERDGEVVDQDQQKVDQAAADLHSLEKQLAGFEHGEAQQGAGSPAFLEERTQTLNQLDELRAQKTAIDRLMQQEAQDRAKRDIFAHGPLPIPSPVSGMIWARAVAAGQSVQAGDDLFHIVDEASIHVEVWIDRRYGPQLSVGDPALIYLSGIGRQFTGRISSFEGTSHRRLDEKINAIDLEAVHPDQYHVSIELDPADRKAVYVGQPAKVLFPGTRHALRARLYFWLTRI